MKQVEQNYRTGDLAVVDVPVPMAGPGTVLVATRVSLISAGTEKQIMDLAKASLAGKAMARPDLVRQVLRKAKQEGLASTVQKVFARLDTPIPLGYSLAGKVLEASEGVGGGLSAGARVACAGAAIANHAEYNVAPKNLVVQIPDGVDDEEASFVTLGAIALQGVRVADPSLGERVVVLGLGLIGQLTVQLLKANGCKVLGFDPNPARVSLALAMGADLAVGADLAAAVQEFTSGHGADAVIVTASTKSSEPLNTAAEISRMKGRVVVVGLVGMNIDRDPFYKRELDLRLSMSYGPGRYDPSYEQQGRDYPFAYVRWTEQRNMQAFLELVAEGRVTPAKLVTHRFPIEEAEKAYALLSSGEPHLAVLLTYPCVDAPQLERLMPVGAAPAIRAEVSAAAVSFIGFGNYAKAVLLPAVRKAGDVALRGVATATGLSAKHSAEKFGFANAATDPAELLSDPATTMVFIATRHSSHAELSIQALEAGKAVFCEKPMAMNEAELQRVATAIRSAERPFTIGFNRRFAPLILQAKSALEGRAGPLVMIYRVNAGTVPGDSWLHGAEGGGRVIGEVCHFIDTLSFIAGAPPISVSAVAAGGRSDAVSILVTFADGSTGSVVYSSVGDPTVPKEYFEAFADGCVVQMDDFRQLVITKGGRRRTIKAATQDKGQVGLVKAFINASAGVADAPIALNDLVAVTCATFAVEQSIRTGVRILMHEVG